MISLNTYLKWHKNHISRVFCAKHIHLKKVNKNHLLKNRKKLKQKEWIPKESYSTFSND